MHIVDVIDCRPGRVVDSEIVVRKMHFREGKVDSISKGGGCWVHNPVPKMVP
jgi:hypothetical protein